MLDLLRIASNAFKGGIRMDSDGLKFNFVILFRRPPEERITSNKKRILLDEGRWTSFRTQVRFNRFNRINYKSILRCRCFVIHSSFIWSLLVIRAHWISELRIPKPFDHLEARWLSGSLWKLVANYNPPHTSMNGKILNYCEQPAALTAEHVASCLPRCRHINLMPAPLRSFGRLFNARLQLASSLGGSLWSFALYNRIFKCSIQVERIQVFKWSILQIVLGNSMNSSL